MMLLMLQMLLAHILGDFLFQPDKWVKDKEQKKYRSRFLYIHVLVHAFFLFLTLGFSFVYWPVVSVVVVTHFVIDLTKSILMGKFNFLNPQSLFFADQSAHLLVIALVAYWYEPCVINLGLIDSSQVILLSVALLTVSKVSAIVIEVLMSKWKSALKENQNNASLEKAGKCIGILERLFIFGFIVIDQWQAIGFLITAKSVFRFGDLSRTNDRKFTEYILIGTLLSFGSAILIGIGYLKVFDIINASL